MLRATEFPPPVQSKIASLNFANTPFRNGGHQLQRVLLIASPFCTGFAFFLEIPSGSNLSNFISKIFFKDFLHSVRFSPWRSSVRYAHSVLRNFRFLEILNRSFLGLRFRIVFLKQFFHFARHSLYGAKARQNFRRLCNQRLLRSTSLTLRFATAVINCNGSCSSQAPFALASHSSWKFLAVRTLVTSFRKSFLKIFFIP